MSADNWTQCPKCKKNKEDECDELDKQVVVSYGKIPADDYISLVEKSSKLADQLKNRTVPEDTLREDYELRIRDGEFSVSYYASCKTCGFKFEFKHEEKVQ
jgi:predicted Zn-ribbon and HTH transcriptional regulator